MGDVNSQFLISLTIIALGYGAKRLNVLSEKDGVGISKLIFNFTLPSLIISIVSSSKIDLSLTLLPVINVAIGFLMAGIALLLFRKEDLNTRGMLSMLLPGLNVALFAYPLAEAILGEKSLKYFAMFDLGGGLVIFGISYTLGCYFSGNSEEAALRNIGLKLLRSIPLMAFMITLAVYLSGFHLPWLVTSMAKMLSRANAPLSLLLLGIYMSFSFESHYWRNIGKVLAARYVTCMAVGLLLYFLLPFDSLFRTTLLIGCMLPIGASVIPYSVQFGYDKKFVASVTNISILISFVLVWIVSAVI